MAQAHWSLAVGLSLALGILVQLAFDSGGLSLFVTIMRSSPALARRFYGMWRRFVRDFATVVFVAVVAMAALALLPRVPGAGGARSR